MFLDSGQPRTREYADDQPCYALELAYIHVYLKIIAIVSYDVSQVMLVTVGN